MVRENHQPFETLDSVQASLEPFLPEYPCQSLVPDTDSPLVKFRLNTLLPSGRTTLGIAFSHGLADGAAFYRFVRLLSNVYVSDAGSTTVVPPEDHPELLPQVVLPEYPPGQSAINEASCVQQLKPYTFAAANNAYEEDRASTQMATLKLLPDELRRLRNDCHSRVGRGLKVTDQDVLTGWAASLVERMEVPITTLIYMINVSSTLLILLLGIDNVSIEGCVSNTRFSHPPCPNSVVTPLVIEVSRYHPHHHTIHSIVALFLLRQSEQRSTLCIPIQQGRYVGSVVWHISSIKLVKWAARK